MKENECAFAKTQDGIKCPYGQPKQVTYIYSDKE